MKGETKLLVFQTRGGSSAQPHGASGWKLLIVSKIEGCVVLDESFPGSRGNAHRHHYVWDTLYARVA